MSDQEIIEGCVKRRRAAQQQLYDKYSRFLLGICLRYSSDMGEAEDLLQDVFVKVFLNIKDYAGKGSFPGWLRRIAVNTSITHYHRNMKHRYHSELDDDVLPAGQTEMPDDYTFSADELYGVLNDLPPGYRMVFNLYAVEGYKHREIAEMLNIDTNTSKSQYSRARSLLRYRLEQLGREARRRDDGSE